MSILVTGAAGFIGSQLVETLAERTPHAVVGLDNFNDYYDPALKRANTALLRGLPRFEMIEGDFCDFDFLRRLFSQRRFDQVVHLGAWSGARASIERPRQCEAANVAGTLALLEAAREFPVQRFLFASSSTVYGRGAAIPFDEDAPLGVPASPYGATKRSAELLGLTYHQLFGVPFVVLRLFSVYGPRVRPDLALAVFARAIDEGRPIPLFGDGSVRRDFTHVRDICAGFVAALPADRVTGECINLGHSEPVEMRRLIELLEAALGKRAIIEQRPARAEDLPVTCAKLDKAQRLLDYSPGVTITDGIAEYAAWFRTARSK
jgi:UDP-glucuronate 4-epimerase